MRTLRLLLGMFYPSLCIGLSIVVASIVSRWGKSESIDLFLGTTFMMLIPSLLCSLLIEFVVNAKVKSNILAILIGGCLGLVISVIAILSTGLNFTFVAEKIAFCIVIPVFAFCVGLITVMPLRYLFVNEVKYKKGILITYLLIGLFVLIGMNAGLDRLGLLLTEFFYYELGIITRM